MYRCCQTLGCIVVQNTTCNLKIFFFFGDVLDEIARMVRVDLSSKVTYLICLVELEQQIVVSRTLTRVCLVLSILYIYIRVRKYFGE